jgi:hypothetical protein
VVLIETQEEEIVTIKRFEHYHRFNILLIPFIIFSVCACTYRGDEYTFSAPFGFKTTQFETAQDNPDNAREPLISSNNGHIHFLVSRQPIPKDGDLETVFNENKAKPVEGLHFQFVSQNTIEIYDRTAIEYIYREFSGEPYWQRREIWVENNGRVYSLECSDPADSTPGLLIPVTDLCFQLVEDFQFKDN